MSIKEFNPADYVTLLVKVQCALCTYAPTFNIKAVELAAADAAQHLSEAHPEVFR